jgi:peptide/nickel transport system substrate-binding protein
LREDKDMKLKKYAALLSFSLLLAMAGSFGRAQAQTYPREQTMILGGDTSYCGMGFNPYGLPGGTCNRGRALTYMSLFWYNWTSGSLQPWLAQGYEWSTDGSTFIIHLRPEARWRDGTNVTANDVVFDFQTEDQNGSYPIEHSIIDSITTADNYTVHFNLVLGAEFSNHVFADLQDVPIFEKTRWQQLLANASSTSTDILSYTNENFDQIDGNGPYLPVYSDPNKIVYQRVDDWWGNSMFGQPAPKYVMMINHATNDLEQRDFDAGSLDWDDSFFSGIYSYVIGHNDVVVWNRNDPNGKIFNTAGAIYLVPNINSTTHPELAQPWLRQAVAYAINVSRIISDAQQGLVVEASPSFITPTGPMADKYIDHDLINKTYGDPNYIPYDTQKAIQILGQHCNGSVDAGWTWNGTPIGPWNVYSVSGWSDVNLMSTLMSGDLQKIGIKLNVNIIDESLYDDHRHAMDFDWVDFTAAVDNSPSPTYPVSNFDNLFHGDPTLDVDPCNYTTSPNYEEVYNLTLKMWNLPIGSNESIAAAKQIQAFVVPELPYIPLYVQIPWSRYHTTYWTGWPTVDNRGPGQGASWWEPIIPQVILMLKEVPTTTPTTGGTSPWVWVGVGIVIVAIIAAGALVWTRRNKPKDSSSGNETENKGKAIPTSFISFS